MWGSAPIWVQVAIIAVVAIAGLALLVHLYMGATHTRTEDNGPDEEDAL
jgi:hypothetical protein